MSNISTPRTFVDLYTDLINKVRQSTQHAPSVVLAKRAINSGLVDMHTGTAERFEWCHNHAVLVTHPTYSTGTLTTAQGGNVQLVGGNFFTTNAYGQPNGRVGGKLKINDTQIVYEIQLIVAFVLATLTPAYMGESDTGVPYLYYEDEYDLATDFLRPIDMQKFDDGGTVALIGSSDFRDRHPRNNVPTNFPRVATILTRHFTTGADVRRVRFAPPPSDFVAIPYTYVTTLLARSAAGVRQEQLIEDTDEPIVPFQLRPAIVLHALASWYRERKDDARAGDAQKDYYELVNRALGDNAIGSQKPRLRPLVSGYRNRAQRPWGGSGRQRYDINGKFDRQEDIS